MTYTLFENRDMRCAADVGRMAELGRFATEVTVYGSAVQTLHGQIIYRATEQEDALYHFIQRQRLEEAYYTPILSLRERDKIPFELREDYVLDKKYALLRQMQMIYEDSGYFTAMQPYFLREPNNQSFDALDAYRKEIEGYFDDTALQLFWGLICIAYESKVLDLEGFQQLHSWYKKVRKQMSDDPVVEDNIGRTFYGFCYLDMNGTRKSVTDTQRMPIVYKQQELLMKGYCVGSILQKTYWFQQFNQMTAVRKGYQTWLTNAQDDSYFNRLQTIKSLPGVITQSEATETQKTIKKYAEAQNAAAYYFAVWNKK
ncbi:MAG: hypothetical protein IJB37_01015 [Peptococcaceae bacterium]|nr:hypothetical protein [Peptococcaceae bacterium]MBQ3205110.1 hypothetical protein [Peptococcaceae bacterium]